MAASSLACHPHWTWPYTHAVGEDPLDVIAAMVDPEGYGVRVPEGAEADQHILRAEPGLSLLSSLYVRMFMRVGAIGRPVADLDEHHDDYIGLTHLVRFDRLMDGLCRLMPGDLGREVTFREDVDYSHLEGIYDCERGADVLARIQDRDGWLIRRYEAMPSAMKVGRG